MRRNNPKTQHIVVLYTEKHLTMAQIGKLLGMTRAGVNKYLKAAGVQRAQGTMITVGCAFCGDPVTVYRGRWRRPGYKYYCNRECYHASLENPDYKPWRQGQRLAVALVSKYFHIEPGMIVHHKDGDNRNNNISNLAVLADQGAHRRLHHKQSIEYVWDGASVHV